MNTFSIFKTATSNFNKETDLTEIYDTTRNNNWKATIIELRTITDKDKQREYKVNKLPAIAFAGLYKEGTTSLLENMEKISGLISIDIDGLQTEEVTKVKEQLSTDPHAALTFISPGGHGIKSVFYCPQITTPETYLQAWHSIKTHLKNTHNLLIDEATKNINRLCFQSWDPEAILNINPEPFHIDLGLDLNDFKAPIDIGLVGKGISEGNRHNELLKLAAHLFSKGLSIEAVVGSVEYANSKCKPPLGKKELEDILKYAAKTKKVISEVDIPVVIEETISDAQIDEKLEQDNVEAIRDRIFSHDKMGTETAIKIRDAGIELMKHYKFITTGDRELVIYIYKDGAYDPCGKDFIKIKLQEWTSGNLLNKNNINEIIGQVERSTRKPKDIFDQTPPHLICLKNGILNIETHKLQPHTPQIPFDNKIDTNYNPTAKCPNIIKFISEVVEPQYIPVIQEYFGFGLYRQYLLKKSMILVGERDTGKTTLLKLYIKLIGKQNCSGESLHKIITSTFSAINLKGKLVNYFDDLSLEDLNEVGNFKIVCGGGYISGEYKYGDKIQFINYAKLLYATNRIAGIRDTDDEAYYSRWLPIPFNKQVTKSTRDVRLVEKLTTKEELEGFLQWILIGLERLLDQEDFSDDRTPNDIKDFMELYSNSLSAFKQECIEYDETSWVSKEDMYDTYCKYCMYKKLARVSKEKFGRDLQKLAYYITDVRKGESREYSWGSVKVVDKYLPNGQVTITKEYI